MANRTKALSNNFNNNRVSTFSAFLSTINTNACASLIIIGYTTLIPKQSSSIHKHCRLIIKEERT